MFRRVNLRTQGRDSQWPWGRSSCDSAKFRRFEERIFTAQALQPDMLSMLNQINISSTIHGCCWVRVLRPAKLIRFCRAQKSFVQLIPTRTSKPRDQNCPESLYSIHFCSSKLRERSPTTLLLSPVRSMKALYISAL